MLKPSQKWLIAGVVVLCMVVFAALFGEAWLERRIRQAVEKKIAASPHFKCGEIALALRPASLTLNDAVLDMGLVAEARHLELKSSEIKLDGIDWVQLILFKNLKIKDLHVESPFVMLSDMVASDSLPLENKAPSNGLSSIHVAHLSVERGRFKIVKSPADTMAAMAADTFDLDLDGLSFNINKKGTSHTVKQVNLDIRNFLLRSDDNLHEIALKRFSLNKKDNSISLTGLTVKPRYGKREFFAHVQKKTARLDFEFPEIVFHGWQFDQVLHGRFVARSAVVNGMKLQVLANQNLAIDPNHYEPLPQEALLKATFGITIDSILVKNGQLEFENIAAGRSKPGSLRFDPLSAVFTNVTNDTARIRRQPIMAVAVVGEFQDKHRIVNDFWVDLSSPDYAFTFKGRASDIPFAQFNGFLTPCSDVVFEKGQVTSIDFEVNADKRAAKGKLNLAYDGLDFYLKDKQHKKSKFLSKVVDILFVNGENNPEDEDFQRGEIYKRRETWRPFFGYWWLSIQSGLKTSILNDFALDKIQKREVKLKAMK